MTKIYTKSGDKGQTSLFGGRRVWKDERRVDAYGCVDEVNALIGFSRSICQIREVNEILEALQKDLFVLGADVAAPLDGKLAGRVPRVDGAMVERLEGTIDRLEMELKPLSKFILPSGSQLGSTLHLARTVARRAERSIVSLSRSEPLGEQVIMYLNRLSDLLFVLARWANMKEGAREEEWSGSPGPRA